MISEVGRATRFLAAFNDIERRLRTESGSGPGVPISNIADNLARIGVITSEQRDRFKAFARLRNAISHGPYHRNEVLADPVMEVVQEIERLREHLVNPARVIHLLPQRQIAVVGPNQPLSDALELVRLHDYSQVPVYDDGEYVGLLTSNCIARWLAHRLHRDGLVEAEPVASALAFAEPQDQALFAPDTLTASKAVSLLSDPGAEDEPPPAALLLTKDGSNRGTPVRVVVVADLPALVRATDLGPATI